MLKNAIKLLRDEEGATAVEYGLIVAAIAGLIIAIVFVLGRQVQNTFNNVQSGDPVTRIGGSSRLGKRQRSDDAAVSPPRPALDRPRRARSSPTFGAVGFRT